MKKLIALALMMTLILSLTACGEPPPSNGNDAYDIGDGTGTYEGETDDNGLFSGWGIWIYHNYRYEGYFENGVPNGEGTLYQATGLTKDRAAYFTAHTSNWVDGYADGDTQEHWHMNDGNSFTWIYNLVMGYAPNRQVVYAIENGTTDLNVDVGVLLGVPPFVDMSTNPSVSAPAGESADGPVNADKTDAAPVDGEYLYLSFSGLKPDGEPSGINTQGLFEASVVFVGDTSETEYLDITEFTIYINGEPQPFSASNVTFAPGQRGSDNTTRYDIYLYRTFSETNPPIPFQAAEIWIEAVINGATVRSRTLDWQEDGEQLQIDDASISQPITLDAAEPKPSVDIGEPIFTD